MVDTPSISDPASPLVPQTTPMSAEYRVRLSHLPSASNPYPGILTPLSETKGLVFPYTPSVAVSQDVDYAVMNMTHSNTDYHAYSRTPNVSVNVSGKFTIQNQREGLYAMAAIHFLRSVSKMYFGEADSAAGKAGIPPPILTLNGYGTYMFHNVKVFLKSHNYTFEENMDMVNVKVGSGTVRLPAMFTLSLSLVCQQTPTTMRKKFSLDRFKSGALLADGGWL